jgi:hypothetical protein
MSGLVLESITKRFGSFVAVDDVALSVPQRIDVFAGFEFQKERSLPVDDNIVVIGRRGRALSKIAEGNGQRRTCESQANFYTWVSKLGRVFAASINPADKVNHRVGS